MKKYLILFCLTCLPLVADTLLSLEDIKKSNVAPSLIMPTGKRETLEPKVDGKNHGLARYYHPNGQLYGVIPWKNGNKHGSFKLYHENGNLDQYLEYKDGKIDGIAIWMNQNESIQQFSDYLANKSLGLQECRQQVFLKDIEESKLNIRDEVFSRCAEGKILAKNKPNPSFSCAKAKLKTEKAICDSDRLARLDRVINERYNGVLILPIRWG